MRELIVDNFAGGGGASTGIELAIGRGVDIAINHDQNAIAMHETNHPDTLHYCESVFDVDPIVATAGYPVGLAWFSPDCTHFSKARGSTPVKKEIRGLAWIVIRWALLKRPRVIMLENVEEFKTWGPTKINENGDEFPDSTRAGETFRAFVDMLSTGIDSNHQALDEVCDIINLDRNGPEVERLINGLGYQVEFKELKACDYGAPTIRKRFFMVMRCDERSIVWPEATHGDPKSADVINGKLLPYRTAAECIDWSIECPSIFNRKKPLAENTMKRIARGIKRFVFDNPNPFIVRIGQTGFGGDRLSYDIDKPLTTITTKAEHLLVSPTIIQYHTERNNSEVRGQDLESPIKTVDTNPRYALVSSFLAKHFGGNYNGAGYELNEPMHTVTATDHNALVTSHLMELRGFCKDGRMLDKPIPTITTSGAHLAQVNAFLLKYYGNEKECPSLDEPLHTVTSKDRFGLVTIHGVDYQIVDIGMRMLQPHELYKAQGFPDWYLIDHDYKGTKYPKSAQVARCGNAVPPPFAEALVRANLPELCVVREVA
ncbi:MULTISPECIES: DNA cytosine methyltransferase [unclassified Gilliamella]|uniref:DNA cytosine methyltransferase n=1 Tax=unclassified Gilliamella TaxID=2685620 RepID=UPI003A5D0C4A